MARDKTTKKEEFIWDFLHSRDVGSTFKIHELQSHMSSKHSQYDRTPHEIGQDLRAFPVERIAVKKRAGWDIRYVILSP